MTRQDYIFHLDQLRQAVLEEDRAKKKGGAK